MEILLESAIIARASGAIIRIGKSIRRAGRTRGSNRESDCSRLPLARNFPGKGKGWYSRRELFPFPLEE
jgi:hypothetical protein